MSLSWHQRRARLASLLKSHGDEEAHGIALDRLMHGQSVIGKTGMNSVFFKSDFSYFYLAKTIEIDTLRFQDKDLNVIGTLEYGQFGVVCLLYCLTSHSFLLKIR